MVTAEAGQLTAAVEGLTSALTELRDALETIVGVVDLGGEAVFVRANLDKATSALVTATTALSVEVGG